jgi:hypothetical protein
VRKLKGKVGKETPAEIYVTVDVLMLLYGMESWVLNAGSVTGQTTVEVSSVQR